jgi:hypothetical protein
MTISDKARKTLWGRSANRCASCKQELVVNSTPKDDESIVGEECHIVSGQPNGPRYDPVFPIEKLDLYQNLILLCCIHHKMVDDQSTTYTINILQQMKLNHEKWVRENLKPSTQFGTTRIRRIKKNIPAFLYRFTTGKEVLNLINSSYVYYMNHDEPQTQEEADLVGEFFKTLQDWGDLGPDLDPSDHVRMGFILTRTLQQLEEAGFYVFGAREVQIIEGGKEDPSEWPVAIIQVIRKNNSEIISMPNVDVEKLRIQQTDV